MNVALRLMGRRLLALPIEFFERSTHNLLAAERAAGVGHHVTLSVVGTERLWAIVGLVVLVSILLHGLTVTPVMRLLDRNRGIDPDTGEVAEPDMPELPFDEPRRTV